MLRAGQTRGEARRGWDEKGLIFTPSCCWPRAGTGARHWAAHASASAAEKWSYKCLTSLSPHLASEPEVRLWMWRACQAHEIVSLVPSRLPLAPAGAPLLASLVENSRENFGLCFTAMTRVRPKTRTDSFINALLALDFKRQNWISGGRDGGEKNGKKRSILPTTKGDHMYINSFKIVFYVTWTR